MAKIFHCMDTSRFINHPSVERQMSHSHLAIKYKVILIIHMQFLCGYKCSFLLTTSRIVRSYGIITFNILRNCHQFSSVAQSCLTHCDLMDCSMPGIPVHHQLPEPTQTHVHRVGDAIQPFHPLSSPSPAFNLPQHQGLFQWVNSHQVAKGSEFQLQHQSFQWIFRTDFL